MHLCEAEGIQDFLVEDLCMGANNESSLLVAVKTLREDANKNARYNQLVQAPPSGLCDFSSHPIKR